MARSSRIKNRFETYSGRTEYLEELKYGSNSFYVPSTDISFMSGASAWIDQEGKMHLIELEDRLSSSCPYNVRPPRECGGRTENDLIWQPHEY